MKEKKEKYKERWEKMVKKASMGRTLANPFYRLIRIKIIVRLTTGLVHCLVFKDLELGLGRMNSHSRGFNIF